SPAEKDALEEIPVVEDVVHEELQPNGHGTDVHRVAGAGAGDEARVHLDGFVEREERGAVGRIWILAVGEAGTVGPGARERELSLCEREAGQPRKPLVVVEVEVS